jgi:hypothetical protein
LPCDQFKEDVEPFLTGQACIELVVGFFGLFKTAKHSSDSSVWQF